MHPRAVHLYNLLHNVALPAGVSDSLKGDQRAKTLVHEAAHYLADHCGQVTREDAETVAEGSAFVVLAYYGIDAGSYSYLYVARWADEWAALKRNLVEVQQVTSRIIGGVEHSPQVSE